jgi:hypothetical protein
MADGWHSEVSGSGVAVSFDASVEAGEFAFSGFQADLKALDFAEPAVHPCFGDALVQVADDLGKAGPLVRRDAEHRAAQASLTCPMFVTTAEFLPQHHAQRQATLQIITAAEANGQARVAEMNRQVAGNLDKIIATLEDEGTDEKEAAASAS